MNLTGEPTALLLTAALLLALSGLPGLLPRFAVLGQRLTVTLAVAASLLGGGGLLRLMTGTTGAVYQLDWPLPFGPALLATDPLSTLFLLPLLLVSGCAALFTPTYWPAATRRDAGRLTFFSGLFGGGMMLVLLARNGVLFLVAWEVMALAAYFLLTTDQRDGGVQRAGTIYLLATHTGTMALFVLFALLKAVTGSFDFPPSHTLTPFSPVAVVMLVAALVGFGAKAGLMPFHFWLPGAHANAPSQVSAMMSGLMLKMGVYGILRVFLFFTDLPTWCGWLLLALGGWSALNGIALAAGQRDLKRLLACSSIENIGIVFIGIGMSLIGSRTGSPVLVLCGLMGAFIHIVNHALFKPLLFLGSGVLIHGVGTRELDRMGGLADRLPVTAFLMLVGGLAICGLPPLNGFVGELFLYLGALYDGMTAPLPLVALVAPTLALVGGLAVITFVKAYGVIFLGNPRSRRAEEVHRPGPGMVAPMVLLAVLCLLAGLFPLGLVRLVQPAVGFYSGRAVDWSLLGPLQPPLGPLLLMNGLLLALLLFLALFYRMRLHRLPRGTVPTWGCGYQAPSPRIQYTGASFSELAVNLFGPMASPRRSRPRLSGIFPAPGASFGYRAAELLLEQVLTPLFSWSGQAFSWLRRLQHGRVHIYVLYIFATLFVLMIWGR